MKLFENEETLKKCLPNEICSVKGETPLLEKLTGYMELTENWIVDNLCDLDCLPLMKSDNCHEPLLRFAAADALVHAIPALDLMLTPNGFAVVSTSNLAPASAPRVERLIQSLRVLRENALSQTIYVLLAHDYLGWHESRQGRFFASSLFPSLDVMEIVSYKPGNKWEEYLATRHKLIDIEDELAATWISPELLEHLRTGGAASTLTPEEMTMLMWLKNQVLTQLRTGRCSPRRMDDIVNYIRARPDHFPLWHDSETALLFEPPMFRNDKNSTGYFF